MTTLAWDPISSLAYSPDCQGAYTRKDLHILSVDEAFQDLAQAVILNHPDINAKSISLAKALNDLLASRLASFDDQKLSPNWHCLIYHASRLLFEQVALIEAQRDSECIINTEKELTRAAQFSEMGFFLYHFSPHYLEKLQMLLRPILAALKERVIEGHSAREILSENQIPRPIVEELNLLFSQAGLITSLHAGFGAPVAISGFSIEISVPKADWWSRRCLNGQSKPPRTAYFHRDETCFVPKALLFLSEVTEDAGPFSMCPSSFKKEQSPLVSAISRIRQYPYNLTGHELDPAQICVFTQSLPLEFRVNSHYGFDIPDATDASETILRDEKSFLAALELASSLTATIFCIEEAYVKESLVLRCR